MIKLSSSLWCLLTALTAFNAYANDDPCRDMAKQITQQGIQISNCRCDKGIHHLHINQAPDLPLTALCNYVEQEDGNTGDYFFKGSLLVSGTITRQQTETFGDTVRFVPEEKEAQYLFNGVGPELRFRDNSSILSALHIPALSKRNRCWRAHASIRIKTLYTLAGPGTDADGIYVLEYTDAQAGEFQQCKASEQDQ